MKRVVVLPLVGLILSGCASGAKSVQASYVSPVLYQNLSCEQLALEAQSVSSRATTASGAQDQKAGQDAAAMAVALVVFWPALFLVGGDGPQAAELSRLKGEMVAIEQASIRNNCGIKFDKPDPKKVAKAPPSTGR